MIVEIIGTKFGTCVKRRKIECTDVEFDSEQIIVDNEYINISDYGNQGADRIKLLVDDSEWINKSLIKIDFSSFKIGDIYEFSDDFKTWKLKKLDAINEENEHPFVTYGEDMLSRSVSFAWRYCREVIE